MLEDDEGENFEASVNTEELERQMEREVNHMEARVIG